MGIFSKLTSSDPNEPSAGASFDDLMAYGKRELFVRRWKPAEKAFGRAAKLRPQDPMPLAYRSWAGRLVYPTQAMSDATRAVNLANQIPPAANKPEPYMSLALACATEPFTNQKLMMAGQAVNLGMRFAPVDGTGAVLVVSACSIFFDLFEKATDPEGLTRSFELTPLRRAGEWLANGEYGFAGQMFLQVFDAGQKLPGMTGMAANFWAIDDLVNAKECARQVIAAIAGKDDRPDSPENQSLLKAMEYFCRGRD